MFAVLQATPNCCHIIAYNSEPCQLIVYSGNSNEGSGVSSDDCYSESTDPMLDLLSDLYSELNVFLCKD